MPKHYGHSDTDFVRQGRLNRLLREHIHDPYMTRSKIPEPAYCPECGAVFHEGRWQWLSRPAAAKEHLCPADARVRDRVPASFLTLGGGFFMEHKEEIMNLVRNFETRQKAEHPMKRIMGMEDQEQGMVITFTEPHIARGIGEAIHDAYEGELDYAYQDEENMLRVYWSR